MLTNNSAHEYETPYKRPFVISQGWTNGTVTLQCGPIQVRHNICRIKPCTSDTNEEDINPEKCGTMSTYYQQLYTFVLY